MPTRHLGPVSLALALAALPAVASSVATRLEATAGSAPRPAAVAQRGRPPKQIPPLSMVASWTATLAAPPATAAAFDAASAYIPLRTGDLVAVSLETGAVLWTSATQVTGIPAAGGGLVYVPRQNAIEALDARTGGARWRTPLPGALSTPMVWQGGRLLAATDRQDVNLLRTDTGQVAWTRPLGALVSVPPVLTTDRVYLALDDRRVVALALETGDAVWETSLPGRGTMLYPTGDRVFVGSEDKFFYCLSSADGGQKWRWRTGGKILATAVVDEDAVYFVSLDNVLRALDRSNGRQKWKAIISMRPSAGPFPTSGLLLVPGQAATIPAFQRTDGKPAGTATLPGEPAFPPHLLPATATSAGGILVVTGEGQVQRLAPILPSRPTPGTGLFLSLPKGGAGPPG